MKHGVGSAASHYPGVGSRSAGSMSGIIGITHSIDFLPLFLEVFQDTLCNKFVSSQWSFSGLALSPICF